MLSRLRSSIAYRAKWARLGIIYIRKPKLEAVRIAGRLVHLSFPAGERATLEYEFGKIFFEDCYRLTDIIYNVRTVLDIGANVGLFTLAARDRFPNATIHCYEPNPNLQSHLESHCDTVGAQRFEAAIGAEAGLISLNPSDEGSLHSTTRSGGTIPQTSFADAVAKLGRVDLLKLDCEGAEWDIFGARDAWQSVQNLAMEYHLWAKEGSTVATVQAALSSLGFDRVEVCDDGKQWGMAFASRT